MMKTKILILVPIVFFGFFLFTQKSFAATYYVSPTGSAAWASATNIDTPTSITTAFSNATAGDLVYLRGGTYSGTTWTINANSGTSDSNRIIFRAYTGETPILSGSGRWILEIRRNWIWLDGLTITGALTGADSFVVGTYNTGAVTGFKITNSTITMTSYDSTDNCDVIGLFSGPVDTVIQNNIITGSNNNGPAGVQMFQGTGYKVLNNQISGVKQGVYQKHPNCDTSAGPEIAYNYVIAGMKALDGRGNYYNIHDNIFVSSDMAWIWGEDGGTGCNPGDTNVITNHNTFKGRVYLAEPTMSLNNATVKNNIITGNLEQYGATMGTWTYNLLGWTQSGSNNINGQPTFTGGANPSTIAGYALTSSSNGYHSADDGTDRGANVTLVGIQTSETPPDTTPPSAPSGVAVS
jgi:hypothetical protein